LTEPLPSEANTALNLFSAVWGWVSIGGLQRFWRMKLELRGKWQENSACEGRGAGSGLGNRQAIITARLPRSKSAAGVVCGTRGLFAVPVYPNLATGLSGHLASIEFGSKSEEVQDSRSAGISVSRTAVPEERPDESGRRRLKACTTSAAHTNSGGDQCGWKRRMAAMPAAPDAMQAAILDSWTPPKASTGRRTAFAASRNRSRPSGGP
jgi:hypothetical protein